MSAEGTTARYQAEAEGKRAINEAENTLGENMIALRLREALLQNLPAIISAATEPMKHIDSIKIVDVSGMGGVTGSGAAANDGTGAPGGSLADQVVGAALRHRAAAPLVDGLLKEVGITGGSVDGLLGAVQEVHAASSAKPAAPALPAGDKTTKPGLGKPAARPAAEG